MFAALLNVGGRVAFPLPGFHRVPKNLFEKRTKGHSPLSPFVRMIMQDCCRSKQIMRNRGITARLIGEGSSREQLRRLRYFVPHNSFPIMRRALEAGEAATLAETKTSGSAGQSEFRSTPSIASRISSGERKRA